MEWTHCVTHTRDTNTEDTAIKEAIKSITKHNCASIIFKMRCCSLSLESNANAKMFFLILFTPRLARMCNCSHVLPALAVEKNGPEENRNEIWRWSKSYRMLWKCRKHQRERMFSRSRKNNWAEQIYLNRCCFCLCRYTDIMAFTRLRTAGNSAFHLQNNAEIQQKALVNLPWHP